MTENQSLTDHVQSWNENGQLYLWGGILATILAWSLFAPAGVIAIYCGIMLHVNADRALSGAVIGGLGTFALVFWLTALLVI